MTDSHSDPADDFGGPGSDTRGRDGIDSWPFMQPCGCNLDSGRCADHAAKMTAIRAAYDGGDYRRFLAMWDLSDGYGVPGLVPPQGYDWSGIRDSTPAAIDAMFKAATS